MSDQKGTPATGNAAGANSSLPSSGNGNVGSGSGGGTGTAPKKPLPEQNPAFRMMGLPRLRLPSQNWMIFLSVTGSIAGLVWYDKWQTKRMQKKWCHMVSHLANEPLDPKTAPRKLTIYLSASPGDGLRGAREHFHTYVKPVLVSAAMDWDVVEGRKEGDVRHKTAEKIRKRRRRNGEGQPIPKEDDQEATLQSIRANNGDVDYPGVGGDLVIGRHTWKEYIRGIHEGYLGPPDPPSGSEPDAPPGPKLVDQQAERPPIGDATVSTLKEVVVEDSGTSSTDSNADEVSPTSPASPSEEVKKEEEKPKRRFPPPYIAPDEYTLATLSRSTPELIGPSVGVRMPHLLGIRNTPIRLYRFFTRRKLQDDIGRQVASAILASHRPYGTVAAVGENDVSSGPMDVPEQVQVLAFEEKDWWKKTVHRQREEHEESVWIEPMTLDERIAGRMRIFELTSDDENRAKRLDVGVEKLPSATEDKP